LRYPIYIPTKGRAEHCLTANFLTKDGVPFWLVVEEQEAEEYGKRYGMDKLLILPFRDQGLVAARNWIKDHATAAGVKRHWQLDDNLHHAMRIYKGKRTYVDSNIAFTVLEDFVDRYENVAIAGLAYEMFVPEHTPVPFYLNVHVYSCTLLLNSIPYRWRQRYNDDTDICLQVLAGGWCTVLLNAFMVHKARTMSLKGGNTPIYQGDGRLTMAKSLERIWPYVVTTRRRFRRPQHVIRRGWGGFDTPLKRRTDIDWDHLPPVDEYGMKLVQVAPVVKSERLKRMLQDKAP